MSDIVPGNLSLLCAGVASYANPCARSIGSWDSLDRKSILLVATGRGSSRTITAYRHDSKSDWDYFRTTTLVVPLIKSAKDIDSTARAVSLIVASVWVDRFDNDFSANTIPTDRAAITLRSRSQQRLSFGHLVHEPERPAIFRPRYLDQRRVPQGSVLVR